MANMLLSVFAILMLFQFSAESQVRKINDVTVADFTPVSPMVNAETDAVVLLDSGASALDASEEYGFIVSYYQFSRMLILKKTAIDDLKNVILHYSAALNGKHLSGIHVFTYNLINGQVVKSPLPGEDFYYDETKTDFKTVKFAYRDLKEGSIIEFDYTERLGSSDLQNWYFQGAYPKIKSVYTVTLPDLFNFSIVFQNKKYLTNTSRTMFVKTLYPNSIAFPRTTMNTISWTFENIPAMPEEPFTSTIDNYLACVKFQISAFPESPGVTKNLLLSWQEVCNYILKHTEFGASPGDISSFIKKQAKGFTEGKTTDLEKAEAIFKGVRDHFKMDGSGVFVSENQSVEKIYKSGTGDAGAINTILILMQRAQGFVADPVILATRDKGLTNQTFPLLDNYNYLICRIVVDGKIYYLDASDPALGFGKIPLKCYNGHARVVTKKNFPVFLAPDSIRESTSRLVEIRKVINSKYLDLTCTNHTGYYESVDLRNELKTKSLEAILIKSTQTLPFRKSLDSFSLANLDNHDEPLVIHYNMTLDPGSESRIYFNPFMNYGITENPFKSAIRNYPVEMPYVLDKNYELNMEIPEGYMIDEYPKPEKFNLNDLEAFYDTKVEVAGNTITIKSKMSFSKAVFEPEDYNKLKDFYASVIRKQSEMIVFKKKGL